MADFGKLNFSVAFNPTSAFPLDARCYFTSLADAQAAAAKAEDAGSTNTVYYIGQKLLVVVDNTATWYTIQPDKTLKAEGTGDGSGGTTFTTDETLTLSENGVLSVNTTDKIEADNTLPVTSAAVQTTVGNINALLATI